MSFQDQYRTFIYVYVCICVVTVIQNTIFHNQQ